MRAIPRAFLRHAIPSADGPSGPRQGRGRSKPDTRGIARMARSYEAQAHHRTLAGHAGARGCNADAR